MARLCLAIATAAGDNPDAAFAAADDCLADAQNSGGAWSISWAQWAYGLAYLRHGDRRRAATLFTMALTAQQDTADHWGPPWSIAALGWHAAATGHHKHAALLLGAAHRQRQRVGVDIHGITLLATLDADAEATARTALGEAAYQSAYERGTRLDYVDAVAAALADHLPLRHDDHPINDRHADDLTRREHDVIRLLSRDPSMTNREMGTRLYISVRTVDTHIAHILRNWASPHEPRSPSGPPHTSSPTTGGDAGSFWIQLVHELPDELGRVLFRQSRLPERRRSDAVPEQPHAVRSSLHHATRVGARTNIGVVHRWVGKLQDREPPIGAGLGAVFSGTTRNVTQRYPRHPPGPPTAPASPAWPPTTRRNTASSIRPSTSPPIALTDQPILAHLP